jgi:hypothetical protein
MSSLWQFDVPSWLTQGSSLLGAGAVGAIVLRLIDKFFGRAKEQDSNRAQIRGELREQVATLTVRVDVLTERLDKARDANNALVVRNARLEAENEALRERYHGVLNLVSIMIKRDGEYREKLGLPPDDLNVPDWIYQRVPGPTSKPPATGQS